MDDRSEIDRNQAVELYQALRRQLGERTRGRQLISAFESDPDQGGKDLDEYLRERLREDPALAEQIAQALGPADASQFTTLVAGGQVDQIINIARLGVLDLTLKRTLFLFRDVRQVVVFLLLLLAVGAGIAAGIWFVNQPRRMHGDFNIAVAQFGQAADRGIEPSETATKISNSLFHYLDGEYKTTDFDLKVEVTHRNIPIILEDLEAERLAKRVNADIVIYGTVHADGSAAELLPRFFVFDKPDTGELTGPSELAHPIPFELSELNFQDDINARLRTRAGILLSFTKGLVYVAADNHGAASRSFQQAVAEAKGHDRFDGEEVLYLLLAMVKRLQRDWDGALQILDEAVALNPDYARAYIARGNVYYAQAVSDWSDASKLDQARWEYEKAASVQAYLPGAYIEEKVHVALGSVYLVQAQQAGDKDLFAQAIRMFEAVTTKYEDTGNDRLRGLAATAYFGLGAAYERQTENSAALSAYERCIQAAEDDKLIARCKAQRDLLKHKE